MGKEHKIPAELLTAYESLIAANPDVLRKGVSMPYTSLNGHMFSFLSPDGSMALRLPQDELEAFLGKYRTTRCEQHGRIMKEYAVVPDGLLQKTQELQTHFECSLQYIRSLKPKPTKQKPTKKVSAKRKPAKKKPTAKKTKQ